MVEMDSSLAVVSFGLFLEFFFEVVVLTLERLDQVFELGEANVEGHEGVVDPSAVKKVYRDRDEHRQQVHWYVDEQHELEQLLIPIRFWLDRILHPDPNTTYHQTDRVICKYRRKRVGLLVPIIPNKLLLDAPGCDGVGVHEVHGGHL